jgi:hypothetical protein
MTKLAMRGVYLLAAGVLLVGCGSSGGSSSKSLKTLPKEVVPTTAVNPATTTTTQPKQQGTATPDTGLRDGQTVQVSVRGFTPGKKIAINECSTKTDENGSGCDLSRLSEGMMTVGADGTAQRAFVVKVGPFGKDNVMCTVPGTECILSVGELAAGVVERTGDIKLAFAG